MNRRGFSLVEAAVVMAIIAGTGSSADHQRALAHALDASTALSELRSAGALFCPPDDEIDDPAHLIKGGLVWSKDLKGERSWRPGFVKDSPIGNGKADWMPYRLRGAAIYDDWGREILVSPANNGGIRLMSAGADGVYVIDPGPNKVLDTDPDTARVSGDDREGVLDNVRVGPLE
jgi:hypothetical protein